MGLQGNVSGWAYRLELQLLRCPPPVAGTSWRKFTRPAGLAGLQAWWACARCDEKKPRGLQLQFLRADLPAAAAVLFPGMSPAGVVSASASVVASAGLEIGAGTASLTCLAVSLQGTVRLLAGESLSSLAHSSQSNKNV